MKWDAEEIQVSRTSDIEPELVRIWSEVLEVNPESIATDANFFSLGGDSLLVGRVMERVNVRFFSGRPDSALKIAEFFTHGTIRALAARIAPRVAERVEGHREIVEGDEGCVAVIGMACRIPGAADVNAFWRNLREGVESIRLFADRELIDSGVSLSELQDPRYVRYGALVEDVRRFDAEYFGLTPREASIMSPEQRLLVECSEEALQDAGHGDRRPGESIGVFVGTGLSTYLLTHLAGGSAVLESARGMGLLAANTCAAARTSHLLDLTGPSITVDTACSSSLVAVHLACQAIMGGQCVMALAGGATVRRFTPAGYRAEEGGIFSPDGHCRPFDLRAQGIVSGSGAGVVLLKRLPNAITDRDSIYAVIRGTAVTNDGGAKAGYTAPCADGQEAAIRGALAAARLDPKDIQYLETHGTGTPVGDLIEISALKKVFEWDRGGRPDLFLGTVKASVGHLEAAAGVAGLIKIALALTHRQFPPEVHLREAQKALTPERTRLAFNTHLREWPGAESPRRAGVSSFGIGGTNAHAVLGEAPPHAAGVSSRCAEVLPVSARSNEALRASCSRLSERLQIDAPGSLADVAHTLQVGRREFPYRRYIVASTIPEAVRVLDSSDPAKAVGPAPSQSPDIVFMFPGQGSQYPRMLRGLESEPLFRDQLTECARLLQPSLGRSLMGILDGPASELAQTRWCQPALFAVEYSLARLWLSWGVVPSLMMGHSLGEYVAACLAGLFSLEDALKLVAIRGALMQRTPPGKMLAARLSAQRAAALLGQDCDLAAVNGPDSCVFSGPPAAIERLRSSLVEMKVRSMELNTPHGFHSRLMDGILGDFAQAFDKIKWGEIRVPFVSNRTAQNAERALVASPEYWIDHLRHTVEFSAGLRTALQGRSKLVLEVGPGNVLGNCVRMNAGSVHTIVTSARCADEEGCDSRALMNAVGRAWQFGAVVDWHAFNARSTLRRVSLPTYPFERQVHWIEPEIKDGVSERHLAERRPAMRDWFYVPIWKQRPRLRPPCRPPNGATELGVRCCLIVDGWPALESALSLRLARCGLRTICIPTARRLSPESTSALRNSQDPRGWDQLLATLAADGLSVDSIVHCSEASTQVSLADAPDEERLSRGVYGALELCQALARTRQGQISITFVTRSAHAVSDESVENPFGAMLSAVTRVIAAELPDTSCRSIDVALSVPDGRGTESSSLNMLVEEIASPVREPVVALRGMTRWVRAYERLAPPDSALSLGSSLLRERGVYLITGGMGGVGWTLAGFLAKTVNARLILVGRTAFPDRSEWQAVLDSRDSGDTVCRRIREILDLERTGSEISIIAADVALGADMKRVIALVRERFGALHGVIHAAGVLDGGGIGTTARAAAPRVMAPKVMGTWVVHEACQQMEPDFFVCCSSVAVALAPAGQYNYCAANAFQDAFCLAQDGRSRTRYISIGWDAWNGVGMAIGRHVRPVRKQKRDDELANALSSAEGTQVFAKILSSPLPQWIVCARDLDRLELRRERTFARSEFAANVPLPMANGLAAKAGDLRQEAVCDNSGGRHVPTEQALALVWRDVLGVEASSPDDDFFSLGGDSLLAVELRARLEAEFHCSVTLKALLGAPTLAGMANLMREAS